MISSNYNRLRWLGAGLIAVAIFAAPISALAQTHITPPKNKYSPSDDVKLGRQAAAQAEQQLPIFRDAQVTDYVASVGERLAAAIPPEYQHPEFHYTFKVVDASDINAFALPGGPMYVNRGMIQAARNEGEMAGVMAHEMSHVALRHGTAQATKAEKYQYGAIAGAIFGAIIGGPVGSVVGQGTQFGLGAAFLRFSREYEREADILGAQIMARAGYDPHDLANMFRTIEAQGSRGGPQWMSDHPNPGNRYAYINQEAQSLRVSPNPIKYTEEFARIKERLQGFPRARSTEEISRSGQRYPNGGGGRDPNGGGSSYPSDSRVGRVEYPSARYRTYREGGLFDVSVPDNWRETQSSSVVTFAPSGAYGQIQGQDIFTHGVQIGYSRNETHSLSRATDEFVRNLTQSNPNLRPQSGYQRVSISGQDALAVDLVNVDNATGRSEVDRLYTTMLRDGSLFYVIGVAPQGEFRNYQGVFQNIVRSIRLYA
jgi:Zn-dependent protease with chaperone function